MSVPHLLPPPPLLPVYYHRIFQTPQLYILAPEDIVTEDGLRIEPLVTSVTCSRRIEAGDLVTIDYIAKNVATGEVFESSYEEGGPLKFVIGELVQERYSLTNHGKIYILGYGREIEGLEKGLIGRCSKVNKI